MTGLNEDPSHQTLRFNLDNIQSTLEMLDEIKDEKRIALRGLVEENILSKLKKTFPDEVKIVDWMYEWKRGVLGIELSANSEFYKKNGIPEIYGHNEKLFSSVMQNPETKRIVDKISEDHGIGFEIYASLHI